MVRGGTAVLSLLVALLLPSAAAAQWTQQALDHQYDLAADLPLRNTPWVGTHNSFNSPAEMGPALSAQDSNQKITLVEQLDLGVRSLELDVHWFFSPSEGGFAPVVCHATGQHAGCTVEKPLATVLDEIRGWSDRHPDQVILLYLEDHLDSEEGYDAAARVVEEKLGDVLYRPSGTGCSELPLELKRGGVETAGKRFIAVSDCGLGSGARGDAPARLSGLPRLRAGLRPRHLRAHDRPLLRGQHAPHEHGRRRRRDDARRRHQARDRGTHGALRRGPHRARPARAG